ncbi:SIS domain-containing protein [Gammaproteobacteria bacterium]|nr:SIS domain-containing protein [Gammaproteobacteria bacterium]
MDNFFPSDNKVGLKEFLIDYSERLNQSLINIDEFDLDKAFSVLKEAVQTKATIYTCGNGGSSAIAEHFVCDFLKGASTDSTIDPKVVPLLSTPLLTALANDLSYDKVFSYQLEKYAENGDILLCVSSSGNSENIINAIRAAKELGVTSLSFVGFNGGRALKESDISLHVSSLNYGIVEDAHHSLMHILAQYLRLQMIDDDKKLGKIKF